MDVVAIEAGEGPREEGGEEGEEEGVCGEEEGLGEDCECLERGGGLVGGGKGGRVKCLCEEGEGVFGHEGGTEAGECFQDGLSSGNDRGAFVVQTLMSQGQNSFHHSSDILVQQDRHADLPPFLLLLHLIIGIGGLPSHALRKGSSEVREEKAKLIRPRTRIGGVDVGTEGGQEGEQVLRRQRARDGSVVLPPFLR